MTFPKSACEHKNRVNIRLNTLVAGESAKNSQYGMLKISPSLSILLQFNYSVNHVSSFEARSTTYTLRLQALGFKCVELCTSFVLGLRSVLCWRYGVTSAVDCAVITREEAYYDESFTNTEPRLGWAQSVRNLSGMTSTL